jgi:hypothetical protein
VSDQHYCDQCGNLITDGFILDEEGVRYYCDAECQTDWYHDHDQDRYGNDITTETMKRNDDAECQTDWYHDHDRYGNDITTETMKRNNE